jgi:hypothetical protein
MRLEWKVTRKEAGRLAALVLLYRKNDMVRERMERNVKGLTGSITREEIWKELVGCLATTQQRSGPGSRVDRFIRKQPFPLAYETCKTMGSGLERQSSRILAGSGIWRSKVISNELKRNFDELENGLWPRVLSVSRGLRRKKSPRRERNAARFVAAQLFGLR